MGRTCRFSQLAALQSIRQAKGNIYPAFPECRSLIERRQMMVTVYIRSKSGKPLMPTTRCGHVRVLLKERKAKVVDRNPFTIQLLYDTPEVTQPLWLGIDAGRTNIGIAVVRQDSTAVMTAQMETRNKEIPKLMEARRFFRHNHRFYGRRAVRRRRAKAAHTEVRNGEINRLLPGYETPIHCVGIRNKEVRLNNRTRPDGWLTPTANHLLLTHMNLVRKLQKYLPITDVVLEENRYEYASSVISQIYPQLIRRLEEQFAGHVHITPYEDTTAFREEHSIPEKAIWYAFSIACTALAPEKVELPPDKPYQIKQFRRHDRQACQRHMLDRKYYLNGKLVAVNRHRASGQKKDSLENYRQQLAEAYTEKQAERIIYCLTVKDHVPTYKDMKRQMPGSLFFCDGMIGVIQSSTGLRTNGIPAYYFSTSGERYRGKKCWILQNNTGIRFV